MSIMKQLGVGPGAKNTDTAKEAMANDEYSMFSEGTIRVPTKAMEVITQVPRIDLDVGAILDRQESKGVTTIVAQGAYASFDGLEELLIKLEIPFIRTAIRNMIQHEVRYYAPAQGNKKPISHRSACDENGNPFLTLETMMDIMRSLGEQALINMIRNRHAMTNIDLGAFNNQIDVDALSRRLDDIYVSVRAYKDAKKAYPSASDQRCQAFANAMAMLTDRTFMPGLGFAGPSARELALDDAINAGKYQRGTMAYEEARQVLIDPTGFIFGPLTKEIARYIQDEISSNDCPDDIRNTKAIRKQMH